MNLQQLQYILDVSQTGSFSQTAKNFFISQTSVSRAVSALEKELGVQIFQRRYDGVIPTVEGHTVLAEAHRALDSCQRMTRVSAAKQRVVRFRLSRFEPIYAAFAQLAREVQGRTDVRITQCTIDEFEVANQLSMAAVDLCLLSPVVPLTGSFVRRMEANSLTCRAIGTIPTMIRISPSHPLYHKSDLCIRDFEQESIIDRGPLATAPVVKPYLSVDSSRALLADDPLVRNHLLDAGLGYCIVPRSLQPSAYRDIPLGMEYRILAITNPRQPLHPEMTRFLELLEEHLGPEYGKQSLSIPNPIQF